MFAKLAVAVLAAVAIAAPAPQVPNVDQANKGESTFYTVGLGACGWTNTNAENVVAINAPQFNLDVCGKEVEITDNGTGNKATAYIVDMCPGCANGDLDMSRTLFGNLTNGNFDMGRGGISWTFTGKDNGLPVPNKQG